MIKNYLLLTAFVVALFGFVATPASAEDMPADATVQATEDMADEATEGAEQDVDCVETAVDGEEPTTDCATKSEEMPEVDVEVTE